MPPICGGTFLGRYAASTDSNSGERSAPAFRVAFHCKKRAGGDVIRAPSGDVIALDQGLQFRIGLSRFPLRGKISSDVLLSSDSVKLSFAPQWVRVTFRAAGRSFPHSLVKVSDGGLTLHSCEVDCETVSDTLTLLMSVASSLVVILNGIVAVYVPASRPLLSTVIETSVLSPACKFPLAGLTLSQFAPSSVSIELFQCPASPQLVIVTVRDLGPLS